MKKNILLLCAFGFSIILMSCFPEGKQSCPVNQLLLNESDYPPDTIFDIIRSPIDEKPKESISRSSYYYESWIGESVIKYRSATKANEIFVDDQNSIFDPKEVYDVWETPLKPGVDNISANQYKSGCGNVKNFGDRCIMLGQYGEYIILFSVDISSNGVDQELFRDLVLKIDNKIATCLNN